MAYSPYPPDIAAQRGYTALMLPNAYLDPGRAQELYQWYIEEDKYVSKVGFGRVAMAI